MLNLKSSIISYVILFLGVFALSTSAIFVKLADAPATITAFYRLFFATAMLFPFLWSSKKNRQEFHSLPKNNGDWGSYQAYF